MLDVAEVQNPKYDLTHLWEILQVPIQQPAPSTYSYYTDLHSYIWID